MRAILATAVAAILTATFPTGQAAELTGRQVIDQVFDRQDRSYEYEEQVMTLVEQSGAKEERQVKRYKRSVDGGSRSLLVFTEPAGVKGTALLTWHYDDKDDDQWLYLPALEEKLKRIAEGGMRNYFMGTDYTYEDLTSESRDKFAYERQKDETLDGQACFVVDATPVDATLKKESGYQSRRMWIRQDIYFIVRTDFNDRRGRLIKQQTHEKLQKIDGNTWRADVAIMKNLQKKHITAVQTTKRSFEEKEVPMEFFTSRFITSGQHVR